MAGGYLGKILFVNLGTGEIKEETPVEQLYRDFIGGYGVGAKILYSRQKAGADPLGADNILGFVTGPLTGTPVTTGCRYTVVAKSPLTGGWGDANSGGHFGPHLKFAGCDAVFLNGTAQQPAYLFIDNGKAELRDAGHLWGKDTYETEDMLKAELGKETEVVCIGPSGEKLSLISCIVNRKGDVAGRSGLGAVMGSKKLKAVAVRGNNEVPLFDRELAYKLSREYIEVLGRSPMIGGSLASFRKYGTGAGTHILAHNGDTPVKNWNGVGVVDFPDASGLDPVLIEANVQSRAGCWRCAIGCKAQLKKGTGEFTYPEGVRRPEYETQAAFGAMCLNGNSDAIAMLNHICDSYGIDTISGGTAIAFAIECYQNGIITTEDTDGIELTWGNHRSIVAMTEKMAKREGFGAILADGVKIAAGKIGKGAEEYAVHIGGQELGFHDPKFSQLGPAGIGPSNSGARYHMDATPGRHTQNFGPSSFQSHASSAAGLCMFAGFRGANSKYLVEFMNAVTGWKCTMEELLKTGERIANIRHAFNLREGINPLNWRVHPRIIGVPPQQEGPLAGVTVDIEAQDYWNLGALDWDRQTTRPSKKKLLELGLDDVAQDLWNIKS